MVLSLRIVLNRSTSSGLSLLIIVFYLIFRVETTIKILFLYKKIFRDLINWGLAQSIMAL